jgi:hypothetical protein
VRHEKVRVRHFRNLFGLVMIRTGLSSRFDTVVVDGRLQIAKLHGERMFLVIEGLDDKCSDRISQSNKLPFAN